jgi:alpha-tubulin suppressor-like RCC1 family protein
MENTIAKAAISGSLDYFIDWQAFDKEQSDVNELGQQVLLPVYIKQSPEWHSLQITLAAKSYTLADKNNVVCQTMNIDSTQQAPLTVYIPITVNDEGHFDIEGCIDFNFVEPQTEYKQQQPLRIGVFAFENKQCFAVNPHQALLQWTKKQLIQMSFATGSDSNAELTEALNDVRTRFLQKYPLIAQSSMRLRAAKTPLTAGQSKTLYFNWPATEDAARGNENNFLPVDGATVLIEDKEGLSAAIQGVVSNGSFTFVVPRNDYRFKITLKGHNAEYGFNVVAPSFGVGDIPIDICVNDSLFTSDDYRVNIYDNTRTIGDMSNAISEDQAKAWSLFQAVKELFSLAEQKLSFTRASGLTVKYDISNDCSRYQRLEDAFLVNHRSVYYWDVVGRVFAHCMSCLFNISKETVEGVREVGVSPYDNTGSSETYLNKKVSINVAFNEGYRNWVAVYLLQFLRSPYKSAMKKYGDKCYTDGIISFSGIDFEKNIDNTSRPYGEDAEIAISRLLWDLTDNEQDSYAEVHDESADKIYIPPLSFYNNFLKNKGLTSISDLYKSVYRAHTSREVGYLGTVFNQACTTLVKKSDELGQMFAEFGMAPIFRGAENKSLSNLFSTTSIMIDIWQLNRNSAMQSLNNFDVMFFAKLGSDDIKLIHTVNFKRTSVTNGQSSVGKKYSFNFSKLEQIKLRSKLIPYCYKNKDAAQADDVELYVMVKGSADMDNGAGNPVTTGPYYGPLDKIVIQAPKRSRQALLFIDSSGSNMWNDPNWYRIEEARNLLYKIADENIKLFNGTESNPNALLPMSVAFVDRSQIYTFMDPLALIDSKIIENEIISYGSTDYSYICDVVNDYLKDYNYSYSPKLDAVYVLGDFENRASVLLDTKNSSSGQLPIILMRYWDIDNLYEASKLASEKGLPVHLLNYLSCEIPEMQLFDPFGNQTEYYRDFNKNIKPYSILIDDEDEIDKTDPDNIAQLALATGGSYMMLDYLNNHGDWSQLVQNMQQTSWTEQSQLAFIADVKFFTVMQSGVSSHSYVYTAPFSSSIIVDVDTKGNFIPSITVNGVGGTVKTSDGLYQVSFDAVEGNSYQIDVNAPNNATGLYSIILYQGEPVETSHEMVPVFGHSDISSAAIVDGSVYVWGNRQRGLAGNGSVSVADNAAATRVSSLSDVIALAACRHNLTALNAKGDVFRWGYFPTEMGASELERSTPEKVLTNIKQIASGELFSMALSQDGKMYLWGNNTYCQFATSDPTANRSEQPASQNQSYGFFPEEEEEENPGGGGSIGESTIDRPDVDRPNKDTPHFIELVDKSPVRLIGSGYRSVFAVAENGIVYNWGYLGFSSEYGGETVTANPQPIESLAQYAHKIVTIGGGRGRGVILLSDGRLIGWNLLAGMGIIHSNNIHESEPWLIMSNVKQIYCLEEGVVIVAKDGTLHSWGYDSAGQSSFMFDVQLMQLVTADNKKVVSAGGGLDHILYVTEDGKLYGVGNNDQYKLDQTQPSGQIQWPGKLINVA